MYDSVGSIGTPKSYFQGLRDAGIAVCEFNPVQRVETVNHRNHRKITVVDGRVAFTGGINISETYASSSRRARASQDQEEDKRNGWRDTAGAGRRAGGGAVPAHLPRRLGAAGLRAVARSRAFSRRPRCAAAPWRGSCAATRTAARARCTASSSAGSAARAAGSGSRSAISCPIPDQGGPDRGGAPRRRRRDRAARLQRFLGAGVRRALALRRAARCGRAHLRMARGADARQDRGDRRGLVERRLDQPRLAELRAQLRGRSDRARHRLRPRARAPLRARRRPRRCRSTASNGRSALRASASRNGSRDNGSTCFRGSVPKKWRETCGVQPHRLKEIP